jgi:hypothetical protein
MDKEEDRPSEQPMEVPAPEPPPFDPDPRLVTYLERGRKSDAERRFREAIHLGGPKGGSQGSRAEVRPF